MRRYILTCLLGAATLLASAQIKKPELMVIPSDVWCITNGYFYPVDNMGTTVNVPNYKQALQENMGLKLAIAKLNDLMAERQFPLQSLEHMVLYTVRSVDHKNSIVKNLKRSLSLC